MKGSNSVRRVRALVVKEFYEMVHDLSTVWIAFILPTLLLFIFGYGISLDYKALKIGAVVEDTSPIATSFLDALQSSGYFKVEVSRDFRKVDLEMAKGIHHGVVVIPSHFSVVLKRGVEPAPIQVIADGSNPNTAAIIQGYVEGVFQNWLDQQHISSNWSERRVHLESRFWFNTQLKSLYYLIPGSLAVILTLVGTLLTSLVIAREWEKGTMESLMATPVKMRDLILSKLIAYFTLGLLSFAYAIIFSLLFYDIPMRGSWFVLAFLTMVYLWTALGLGLFISLLAKNQVVASQIAIISGFLPSFMLSGFIFEIASMPAYIRVLTHFIPAKYFVTAMETIFLAGNIWGLVFFNILVMIFMGLILFFIINMKLVKRLD